MSAAAPPALAALLGRGLDQSRRMPPMARSWPPEADPGAGLASVRSSEPSRTSGLALRRAAFVGVPVVAAGLALAGLSAFASAGAATVLVSASVLLRAAGRVRYARARVHPGTRA
ncbi:hypothetical protein [Demequina iriomotensis]|uniref:hypothetical protein n=1 Tax=Demequina iriomotensis TaxID=1536641 RepID=UPI000782F297|nr:hypothetical protein [Demequina iriomotensis]